jgi:hypothetical protein
MLANASATSRTATYPERFSRSVASLTERKTTAQIGSGTVNVLKRRVIYPIEASDNSGNI